MAITIDLSGLTKYTDQLSSKLVSEAVLKGASIPLVSLQTGVKYIDALNIMTSTLTVQAGGCAAIAATGSVALTQRNLQVCPLKVEEQLCLQDFEQYWTGQFMKDGSYQEDIPSNFNQVFVADKVAKIQAKIEDYFWSGSTGGTYSNTLTLCNGILHQLELGTGTSSVVTGAGTYSGALTAGNAITVIDQMVSVVPSDAMDASDLILFMNHTNYRTYAKALRDANLYHYDGQENNFSMIHPGTNVKIMAVRGLKYTNKMVLSPASNLVFGTDLMNDFEKFQVWYEKKDDVVYFRSKWKQGAQVIYPQLVVLYRS
jgi:hypothetical protein